jgi:hypothetical protein
MTLSRQQADPLMNKLPKQDEIERVILRRLHEDRVAGYTLEMAHEIAALALQALDAGQPVAAERGPETEAELKRDGHFLVLDWWRHGLHLTARIYEPQFMPTSAALADVLALAIEMRPSLAEPSPSVPADKAEPAGWFWRWANSDEWRMLSPGVSDAGRADFIRDQERIAPIVVAPLYPAPAPASSVEALAEYIATEWDYEINPVHGAQWPKREGDDGYRGNGGYVALQPPDVLARCREQAQRLLSFLGSLAALSPPPERVEAVRPCRGDCDDGPCPWEPRCSKP